MPSTPARLIAASLLLATAAASAQDRPAPTADATEDAQASLPHWRDPLVPALEIVGFEVLLNRFNRCCGSQRGDYAVTLDTIRHNLTSGWVVDNDPFSVNQFAHPYQGSMAYGFARSNGFNFWESTGYALGGSALWEIAGERTPPSRNDLISTGIGGSFLGESLFRMANLLLEQGGGMSPRWRETVAAAVAPSAAFNRWFVQDRRAGSIFSSHGAAYYSRLQLGFVGSAQNQSGNSIARVDRAEAQADFLLDYGLPGQEGYAYRRPFDYFAFQSTVSSANGFENVMTRGMLLGTDYHVGRTYRGILGLYGSYDYISPQTFRISTSALSLGTTGQWRHGDWVVQGTGMAGLGYAAVGTINSAAPGVDRDYHYGLAPQALLATRVIHSDKWALDLTAREYFVSNVGSGNRGGHDNIARADIAFTWRIKGPHAITVKYLWNRRDARYPDLGDRGQTRGTAGIFYTLLGQDRFGTVDWK